MAFEQGEMFPDDIPDIVMRIWKAHGAHYATGTHEPPTRQQLSDRLLRTDPYLKGSKSEIDRARKDWPKLLSPWPIRRGQRPPWLPEPEPSEAAVVLLKEADRLKWEAFDEHGARHVVEAVADEHGLLHLISRSVASLAAGLAAAIAMDGMDGKFDHVIHWCRVLAEDLHMLG